MKNNLILFGNGGFGREVYSYIKDENPYKKITFMVDDEYYSNQVNTIKFSDFEPEKHSVLICVGNPSYRKAIVDKFPKNTNWYTFISNKSNIYQNVYIGEGSIICPGVIITTNIVIGKHAQLNLQTTIGHDTVIGDYLTTAPGVKISGNCVIGDNNYFGTNSSIKEKLQTCEYVTVGLNGGVIKDIKQPGTYIGTPVKLITI